MKILSLVKKVETTLIRKAIRFCIQKLDMHKASGEDDGIAGFFQATVVSKVQFSSEIVKIRLQVQCTECSGGFRYLAGIFAIF